MLFVIVIIHSLLLIALLFLIIKIVGQKTKNAILKRIKIKTSDILIMDKNSNFFGLQSLGIKQLRGNCVLILTKNHLHSYFILPRYDIKIPLKNIENISLTKSFLGKSIFKNLIKVDFKKGDKTDSAAWFVHDTDSWIKILKEKTNL
jgi:hypothetical protein